jgi:hypothetical protein
VLSPRRLRPLSNLKLELFFDDTATTEIYTKVVSVAPGGSVTVRFTSLPAEIDRWLRQVVNESRGQRA